MKFVSLVVLFALSVPHLVMAVWNTACIPLQKKAVNLSLTCCKLTHPSLDSGIQDCADEVLQDLKSERKFTHRDILAVNVVSTGWAVFLKRNYCDIVLPIDLFTEFLCIVEKCIEECNYIGNGYIGADPPFHLDLNNVQEHLVKFQPEPQEISVRFLMNAYMVCGKFLINHLTKLDIKYPNTKLIAHSCNPFALQITTCVRIHSMQRCPEQFYVKSNECREAQTFFKTCVANILTA